MRKRHYETLNNVVFSQLSLLSSHPIGYDLRTILLLNEYSPSNDLVYEDAKLHMEKYYHNLSEETDNLLQDIRQHNTEVHQLMNLINDFINKKSYIISDNKLFPPTFYDDTVRDISSMIWEGIVQETHSLTNIKKIKEDIDVFVDRLSIIHKGNNNNELAVQNRDIGKGTYPNASNVIRNIFVNNVIKNEEILQELIYIINSRLKLQSRIKNVSRHSYNISNAIEIDYYNVRARCCPTIPKAIRNYFF